MNRILTFLIPLLAFLPPAFARQDRQGRGGEAGAVLTLREAVRQALARGPDVLLAQAEAAKAGEALRETRSINLPQVVVGTGLAYNNGFPLSIEGAAPSIIQLGVNQAIFSKKNRNLIREAEEGSKAGAAAPDSARNGCPAAGRAAPGR
jgi:outer membrane protein TolC